MRRGGKMRDGAQRMEGGGEGEKEDEKEERWQRGGREGEVGNVQSCRQSFQER